MCDVCRALGSLTESSQRALTNPLVEAGTCPMCLAAICQPAECGRNCGVHLGCACCAASVCTCEPSRPCVCLFFRVLLACLMCLLGVGFQPWSSISVEPCSSITFVRVAVSECNLNPQCCLPLLSWRFGCHGGILHRSYHVGRGLQSWSMSLCLCPYFCCSGPQRQPCGLAVPSLCCAPVVGGIQTCWP